jgi:hypothetical protein
MRDRVKSIASLTVFIGASALVGCAWVQTPREYASANGYRAVDIHGDKYYCRREQPEVAGSPLVGVSCLTRTQLSARVAQLNSARFPSAGPAFGSSGFGFETQGLAIPNTNSMVNGSGMWSGTGAHR